MNVDEILAPLTLTEVLGLGIIILFAILMITFTVLNRKRPWRNLRRIPAFSHLGRAIGLAVEDGKRLHVSIGRGNLTGPRSAAAFVGLSMLEQIVQVASESDHPPLATSGDGALAILSQDTLRKAYREMGAAEQFDPDAGQLAGLTPFSYAAGTLPIMRDENVSANIIAGNFGNEVALMTDAAERGEEFTLAGADSLPAQAIMYATAQEPLIGEELYAGGAYLRAAPMHAASLRAQDIVRWLLVAVILLGGIAKLFGV